MKRIAAITALIAAAAAFVVFGTGAGNDTSGDYRVRAEFRNAFTVIKGLDVKIAGVKVGKVESLDVTPRQTADVVLRIDLDGFKDFRKDATCTIRPQSLIGEKFIECTPTQPRATGAQEAPPLDKITSGPGKGEYALPISQTSLPVDLDLLNNILRLPYRQRLSIILNELGTGLAGRGADLRAAIRNANPALKQTDKVLKILADQNKTLADLAKNSDTIFQPLARERSKVADFVVKANNTARATAERRGDLEATFQKLPAFLRQLKPTMTRLGALSDEMTPVLTDLGKVAPDVSRFIMELGPFSKAADPSLKSLGDAADVGRRALVESKPIVQDLREFTIEGKPLTQNLSAFLESTRDTGGIERLMDYIFYQVAAVNGFDAFGHYLRANLIVNPCSTYQVNAASTPDCTANFQKQASSSRSARSASAALNAPGRDPVLARTDAVLRGMSADEALRLSGAKDSTSTSSKNKGKRSKKRAAKHAGSLRLPAQLLPGQSSPPSTAKGGSSSGQSQQQSGSDPQAAAQQGLLDYLLGPS